MMRRRLCTSASAVLLLLCVAMAVLWVRSYSHQDHVFLDETHLLISQHGDLVLLITARDAANRVLRFAFAHAWRVSYIRCILPMVIASICFFWLGRDRRSRGGLCISCDYDLTGNTSGTCPECGTPVPQKGEAHA